MLEYILLRTVDSSLIHSLHDSRSSTEDWQAGLNPNSVGGYREDSLVIKYIINGWLHRCVFSLRRSSFSLSVSASICSNSLGSCATRAPLRRSSRICSRSFSFAKASTSFRSCSRVNPARGFLSLVLVVVLFTSWAHSRAVAASPCFSIDIENSWWERLGTSGSELFSTMVADKQ